MKIANKATSSRAAARAIIPFKTVTLTWTPNYIASNEVTKIYFSTNLVLPLSDWQIAFEGSTNQCVILMQYPIEFFIAANTLNP